MTYVCNVKYGTFHISHCHIFLMFIGIYLDLLKNVDCKNVQCCSLQYFVDK